MADFKLIASPTVASNASISSGFSVPGEFTHFSFHIPATSAWCATTTCAINIQGSYDGGTTYFDVAYSNNPATTTSAHAVWSTAGSAAVSGAFVICEALQFVPYARFRLLQTSTAGVTIRTYGRKFD